VFGRLVFFSNPETQSRLLWFLSWVAYYLCRLIPSQFLPSIPNTVSGGDVLHSERLPLILWSHGKGGNVHDHALMLSQLAVEVPAVCICVTHTDGSADTWHNSRTRVAYFHHPRLSGHDERFLSQHVETQEYQVRYRVQELVTAAEHVRSTMGIDFGKVIAGGFDFGGPTALAASKTMHASGIVSLDGAFSLDDKFSIPREAFTGSERLETPLSLLLSDEWSVWNRPAVERTKILEEKAVNAKLITVKQTKHLNFTECMYWIPKICLVLLRLSGVIHRRGTPRQTYRRTVKWLVALVQQYVADEHGHPVQTEL
jgi:predicted esterase